MQISNILSKFSHTEKPQDYFLALEIASEFVVAAIWTVVDGKTKLVKVSQVHEWEEEKELLMVVDECISTLLQVISRKIKGIIFGLEEGWVETNKIVPDKQKMLREICQKLELKPLGFVVITEALIQYLKITEGLPLSAVLVKLEQTQSSVSLVKLGRLVKTELVGLSEDLSSDLKEALVRFGDVDSFPSRIILFDGLTDFEEARQQITSFDWHKEMPFLHIPRVDILERNITIKALAIAGGSEIAKSLGFNIVEQEEKPTEKSEDALDKETKEIIPSTAVVPDKDKVPTDEKTEDVRVVETETNIKDLEQVGFVANEDILEKVQNVSEPDDHSVWPGTEKNEPEINAPDISKDKKNPIKKINLTSLLGGVKNFIGRFVPRKVAATLILPVIILFALLIGGIAFYWYVPRAEITLYLDQKKMEQEITVTGDKTISTIDVEQRLLPIEEKKVQVSGSKTIDTTGSTLVGDKAVGTVTVYNKTSVTKAFSKDTPLIAENGLKFYLDEDIEIASRSAETTLEGEQIVYGKKDAKIVAATIGPEYNLAKDTEFSVQDYTKSNFSAIATEDISGGSSREISAVSEDDVEEVFTQLEQELIEKAKQDFIKTSDDKEIFSDSQQSETTNEEYDKEVGDEGDSLTLNLELNLTNYLFSKDDLNSLMAEDMLSAIPSGYSLEKTDIGEHELGELSEDGQVKIRAKLSAMLLPQIDINDLKNTIRGRYPHLAKDFFNTLPGYQKAEIEIYPSFLPAKLKTLPRQTDKILITVESEL